MERIMKLTAREIAIFGLLGALMYASKMLMELAPNIHLLGVFTIAFTVVYRKKALYPIYIYVLLNGIFSGFNTWWVPYLYIWTVLWGVTMLLPKKLPKKIRPFIRYLFMHEHLAGVRYYVKCQGHNCQHADVGPGFKDIRFIKF